MSAFLSATLRIGYGEAVPTSIRFALHFSGQDAFDQEEVATKLLRQIDGADHAARARLNAIVAASRVLTAPAAAEEAAAEAAREAQLAGDEVSRAWAMIASCVVNVAPESQNARLSLTREAMQIAQATGEVEFVPTAYFLHLGALAERGAIDELDLALSPTGAILAAFPGLERGRHVAWFRCLRAMIDGQADVAEQLADAAFELAQEQSDPDAQSVWLGQLAIIRWMQGRVVELEPVFLQARQSAPHEPVWAVSLAWMWLQQGRRSAARALITTIAPISQLPPDRNWLATACILAIIAAELGEESIATDVRDALLPFDDHLVTMGLGVTTWGTVSRPLALVALALGDEDAAIAHYRMAVDVAARAGAHPWLAEAQIELARILMGRSEDAEREEAFELARDAVATGRALQLRVIEEAAAVVLSLLAPLVGERSHPQPVAAPHAIASAKIRVLGAFEVVCEQGAVARWQSRKARQLLQILIAKRGVAISRESVMHLLWPDESPQRLANRFSVAASTVRRALDPSANLPKDTYLESSGPLVRLNIERIDLDVESFLAQASTALSSTTPDEDRGKLLTEALRIHRGDVLMNEPEELWAQELQREVHVAFFAVCHALAEISAARADQLTRLDCYRRILAVDPYDQRAHEGQLDALRVLGATGQYADARQIYARRMDELGIPAAVGR